MSSSAAMAVHMHMRTRPIVPVYFATDRLPVGPKEGWYGVRRHTRNDGAGLVDYGVAEVGLPATHARGAPEDHALRLPDFPADAAWRAVVSDVDPLGKDAFFGKVKAMRASRVLVFVHGYNMTFSRALRRTAQMAYDLQYPGPVLLFSWPSRGSTSGYVRDLSSAQWAAADLEDFLLDVARRTGARQVDIVAHSMGSQPLVAALQDLAARQPRLHFREVVLAAPDMDADMFRRALPSFRRAANRLTLYASSSDEALKASKSVNGYSRAGDASEGIFIAPGVDTIDASPAGPALLGHSYYKDGKSALADIGDLLRTGNPPAQRSHLRPALLDGARYWRLTP